MPAPVSVVIPVLNEAARIGPCLAAIFEGVAAGLVCEVILADGGSTDGTPGLADAVGARLVTAPPGRGLQLDAGCRAARGAWLLVLHADTVPGPGWVGAVRAHMARFPGKAGYFRLRFDASGPAPWALARWANFRARLFGLPYGDQGMLVSRQVWEAAGGYKPIPLMEDVALARALARGGGLRALDATAVTSAERYEREGWLRRGLRNGLTLMRYLCGVPAERLARDYRDYSADLDDGGSGGKS